LKLRRREKGAYITGRDKLRTEPISKLKKKNPLYFSHNLTVELLEHIHLILKVQNTGLFMENVLFCEAAVDGCFTRTEKTGRK
jgi:hypothetical protein